jgi:hypothetical protein
MNVTDALINDGIPASVLSVSTSAGQPKVLKEIWIAVRNDGLPGAAVIGDGTKEILTMDRRS